MKAALIIHNSYFVILFPRTPVTIPTMRLPSNNVSHILLGIPLGLVLGIVIHASLQVAESNVVRASHFVDGTCGDVCTPEGEDLPGHTCPNICKQLCCDAITDPSSPTCKNRLLL